MHSPSPFFSTIIILGRTGGGGDAGWTYISYQRAEVGTDGVLGGTGLVGYRRGAQTDIVEGK